MNDALDQVISALGRQIRKNKSKLDKAVHTAAIDQYIADYAPQEKADKEEEYKVVRSKHFFVKPLSVEEAILQMNMLGHQFFMFRNEHTGEVNVVYKRRDGNYGFLEPNGE
jgi:putative sigma-54 modulation protein